MIDALEAALLRLAERRRRRPEPEPWIATFSPSTGLEFPGQVVPGPAVPDKPRFVPHIRELPELSVDEIAEALELLFNGHVSWQCSCGCNRRGWRELRGLPALRGEQAQWVEDMQERADARWRADPAVQAMAEREAAEAAEKAELAAQEQEKATRRQRLADEKFGQLVRAGLDPREAAAEVAKHSKDF